MPGVQGAGGGSGGGGQNSGDRVASWSTRLE